MEKDYDYVRDNPPWTKRVAGLSYRSEQELLDWIEEAYKRKIVRRRRVTKRKGRILYQILFHTGFSIEVAFMPVGLKGIYVRYCKAKKMKWRNKSKGGRPGVNR